MDVATSRLEQFVEPGRLPVRVLATYHASTGRHSHDFYELVYAREGFSLHEVGGKTSLLMQGDLFVVRPGVQHKYSGSHVMQIYNCIFRPEALGEGRAMLERLPTIASLFSGEDEHARLHLDLSERKAVSRTLAAMADEFDANLPGADAKLRGMLACLLVDYARAYEARAVAPEADGGYTSYARRAMEYIDANYAKPGLTVREIAEDAGVSADYLSRRFREATGIAAQEYLRRYRFARAMEALDAGAPVGEACESSGFRNLCHFSREFKRELGVTPTQYKKQNGEGG